MNHPRFAGQAEQLPRPLPPLDPALRRSPCPQCAFEGIDSPTVSKTQYMDEGYFATTWICWAGLHGSGCNYRKVI